jgi:hypothetical protein
MVLQLHASYSISFSVSERHQMRYAVPTASFSSNRGRSRHLRSPISLLPELLVALLGWFFPHLRHLLLLRWTSAWRIDNIVTTLCFPPRQICLARHRVRYGLPLLRANLYVLRRATAYEWRQLDHRQFPPFVQRPSSFDAGFGGVQTSKSSVPLAGYTNVRILV